MREYLVLSFFLEDLELGIASDMETIADDTQEKELCFDNIEEQYE